jgi:hypothetical protein
LMLLKLSLNQLRELLDTAEANKTK